MTISNRYNLLKQLGEGGFGEVWLAKDQVTGQSVAMKLYKINGKGHQELVREFNQVSGLNNENLLKANHVDRDNNQNFSYLVMDYCPYGSLEDLVGKMNEDEIWRCIRDISSGLVALSEHTVYDEKQGRDISAPVIHQDLKPANILIRKHDKEGHNVYAIADFGISKTTVSQKSGSTIFTSAGTLPYMGPERFSPDYIPRVESDIWSFGAMLYELVEGKPPFPSMDDLSGGNWLNQKGVEVPVIHNGTISRVLKDLIYECLSKNPNKRPNAKDINRTAFVWLEGGYDGRAISSFKDDNDNYSDNHSNECEETISYSNSEIHTSSIQHPDKMELPPHEKDEVSGPMYDSSKPRFRLSIFDALKAGKRQIITIVAVGLFVIVGILCMPYIKSIFNNDEVSVDSLEFHNVIQPNIQPHVPSDFVFAIGGDFSYEKNYIENHTKHTVHIDSFYISAYELTQGEYKRVMGNLKRENRLWLLRQSWYIGEGPEYIEVTGDSIPVRGSYEEFVYYCNKRSHQEGYDGFYEIMGDTIKVKVNGNGYRLVTPYEWIYISYGGKYYKQEKYLGGNSLGEVAWYAENSKGKPHPVGQKKPNRLGVYDIQGNVREILQGKNNDKIYCSMLGCYNVYNWNYPQTYDPTSIWTNRKGSDKEETYGTRIALVPQGYSNNNLSTPYDY